MGKRRSNFFFNFLGGLLAGGGILTFIAFICLTIFAGPLALGYSLTHLLPLVVHHAVDPWTWPALVATILVGWLTASVSVPVGLITWLLVLIGVLA